MIAAYQIRETRRSRRTPVNFHISSPPIFYEVTQPCDFVCQHCHVQTKPHCYELTTNESMRLIDQLTDFPSRPASALTGADPFKFRREDTFELVEHAAWLGLEFWAASSATPLVTGHTIRRLRAEFKDTEEK